MAMYAARTLTVYSVVNHLKKNANADRDTVETARSASMSKPTVNILFLIISVVVG